MIGIILLVDKLGYQIINNKNYQRYFIGIQYWGMGEVMNCFRSCPVVHVITVYLHHWVEDAIGRH